MAKGKRKIAKSAIPIEPSKSPKHTENPESYYQQAPVWAFNLLDRNHPKWGLSNIDNLYSHIIEKLISYEGMTWDEIIKASGGRSHGNNNHFEDISSLSPAAQKRWRELNLEQYDRIFSLRLAGKHRLYGILLNGIFRIIWSDQCHEIYPLDK